jgi:P-type E1-E2 ATPase
VGFEALRSLMGNRLGIDVIALAAIVAAVVLGEALTAGMIGLMVAGGEALEAWAEGRAKRALHDLMARAPRRASRITTAGIEDIDVATIRPGDRLLVRPGETVAADGVLEDAAATLDEAALTGDCGAVP